MTYSIVYTTLTGNTKLLAETVRTSLPEGGCVYFGEPGKEALEADRIFVGFWTDRGTCNKEIAEFLQTLRDREVFLFGSAGYVEESYCRDILRRTCENLDSSVQLIGSFLCQGKMQCSVRARYEKMREDPNHRPDLEEKIQNFDQALTHPDDADLQRLRLAVRTL